MAGLIGTEDAIQKLKYLPLPDYLPTDKPINDWEHPKVKWHYESSFYDLKVLDSVKRGKSGPRPISKYNVKKVYN